MDVVDSSIEKFHNDGFLIISSVFDAFQVQELLEFVKKIGVDQKGAVTARSGKIVASRNVIEQIPNCVEILRNHSLFSFMQNVLGDNFGLTRALYFDKPPWRSWTLPWHKDMTIAVKNNRLPSNSFSKPTTKGGIQHVEAPEEVLSKMVTFRIHLDDNTLENGALKVIIGSHKSGKSNTQAGKVQTIIVNAGDVLAMRPLISHSSGHSKPETKLHRRTLHFEVAGISNLPDEFQWHHFQKI